MKKHEAHHFDKDEDWGEIAPNITREPLLFTDVGDVIEYAGDKGANGSHTVFTRPIVSTAFCIAGRVKWSNDSNSVIQSGECFVHGHDGMWPEGSMINFECMDDGTAWRCFTLREGQELADSKQRIYEGQNTITIPRNDGCIIALIDAVTSEGNGSFMLQDPTGPIKMTSGWAWVVAEAPHGT